MSTETAILATLQDLNLTLARLIRRLDQLPATQEAPGRRDRLTTAAACRYAGITDTTLYRWRDRGLVHMNAGPRPWSRQELDLVLDGASARSTRPTRGHRRSA